MQLNLVAQGGTGYLNEGLCCNGAYANRASDTPHDDSPLIIAGGLNGLQAKPAELRTAAISSSASTPTSGPRCLSARSTPLQSTARSREHISPKGHQAFAADVAHALGL